MTLSEMYKGPLSPLSKWRHSQLQPLSPSGASAAAHDVPDWAAEEYSDLLSKDRTKQKEALRRYLSDKVRNDWVFEWPPHGTNGEAPSSCTPLPPGPEVDAPGGVQDETLDEAGYHVDDEQGESTDGEVPGAEEEDNQSVYSVVSEDPSSYQPRLEWASDLSDNEAPTNGSSSRAPAPSDVVGNGGQYAAVTKQATRRRHLRQEMTWNQGLRCFEARRDAWTGARTVQMRAKPVTPQTTSPRSPRKFFFRRSGSGSPPKPAVDLHELTPAQQSEGSSAAKDSDGELRKRLTNTSAKTGSVHTDTADYPVVTILPIGMPILPPQNPLRASITPSVYLNIYDKVIIHNLQPSCPINLSDMIRASVAGWQRDGEWPPRPPPVTPGMTVAVRRKKKDANGVEGPDKARRRSFGLLHRDKDKDDEASSRAGKGIRKSLQRAFGIGQAEGGVSPGA